MHQVFPDAIYEFSCDRIWFTDAVFITKTANQYNIYTYPNILVHKYTNKNVLENVLIKDKIQLIFKKHNAREIKTFSYATQQKSFFRFKDDFVYYRNAKLFGLIATYNTVISGMNIYRYGIESDKYKLESYALYFPVNGYIFDKFFFDRYKLNYENTEFTSNGKNIVLWDKKFITVDMMANKHLDFEICGVKITENDILCKIKLDGGVQFLFLDIKLDEVCSVQSSTYYESMHYGFIIQNEGEYLHILDGKVLKVDCNFSLIEARTSQNPENINFSFYQGKYIFYMWNNTELIIISDNVLRVFGGNAKEYDRIFDAAVYKSATSLANIIFVSSYENRLLIVTQEIIALICDDYVLVMKNIFGIILNCDAKTMTVTLYENSKRRDVVPYDLLFAALTLLKLDISENKTTRDELETYMLRLCRSDKCELIPCLITNSPFNTDLIICSVYRKSDVSVREKLVSCLPHKFFDNITDTNALNMIFLYYEIDHKYYVSLCVDQNNFKCVRELYDYYDKNDLIDEKSAMLDVLWLRGELKMLSEFIELDLDDDLQKVYKLL